MTKQITLEEALELVDFFWNFHRKCWEVDIVNGNCSLVKGNCDIVEGNCDLVKGHCGIVEGNCGIVEGNCNTVEGNCDLVKGDCDTVVGEVFVTINGREWEYIETPKEKLKRLIETEADHEQLLEAFNEMEDN